MSAPIGQRTKNPRQVYDGEEISLAAGVALLPGKNAVQGESTCCNCGIVHLRRYRITKRGTLKMTSWRKT